MNVGGHFFSRVYYFNFCFERAVIAIKKSSRTIAHFMGWLIHIAYIHTYVHCRHQCMYTESVRSRLLTWTCTCMSRTARGTLYAVHSSETHVTKFILVPMRLPFYFRLLPKASAKRSKKVVSAAVLAFDWKYTYLFHFNPSLPNCQQGLRRRLKMRTANFQPIFMSRCA